MADSRAWSWFLRAYRQGGWSGIARHGMITALGGAARVADAWARRLEQLGGVHGDADKACLARNALLRSRHQGQRCFIVGNGPSLKRQSLEPLSGEVTFVMNAFWKHPLVERWQPTYYCLADPVYFDQSEAMETFFADLRSRIHSTTFLVPLAARQAVQNASVLPLERTHFAAFRGQLADGLSARPDLARVIPGAQSVSQLAIMAAMYMGCSPIYLLGLDHDWLAQRGMDRHFYEGVTVQRHPVAHGNLDRASYASDLEAVLKLWNGYEHLQACAVSHGIRIVNATLGGFLDVFPRVEYESLFAPTK
jgi:hypothetical protein